MRWLCDDNDTFGVTITCVMSAGYVCVTIGPLGSVSSSLHICLHLHLCTCTYTWVEADLPRHPEQASILNSDTCVPRMEGDMEE
jgi:hypothetical protein